MIHTASQFYDQGNQQRIPDWTRFDVGLRTTFLGSWGKPVTLRATVENVTGTNDTISGRFVPEIVSPARAALERSRFPHCEAINRKSYDWASTGNGFLTFGNPRTYLVSAQMDF